MRLYLIHQVRIYHKIGLELLDFLLLLHDIIYDTAGQKHFLED